jgi:transcriptional regulator GlxA family with amidase domain
MIEVIEEKIEQGVKASELTVEEIARVCLGREVKRGDKPGELFAKQTDATLRHYEVGVRLRECLKKLSAQGMQGARLDDIAKKCGFWGGAALTTAFYKWFGISISEVSRHSHLESCQE